ncbi:MAG: hypothetical protein HHAS10_10610 [Candidatus Altimarinota bacterium]
MSRLDLETIGRSIEQLEGVYSEAFPALRIFQWELQRKAFLDTLSPETIEALKKKKIDVNQSLFDGYRDYYRHPEMESNEPLVLLSKYGVVSQDVYYGYSQVDFEKIVMAQKIEGLILRVGTGINTFQPDTFNLLKDVFQLLSPARQKEVISEELGKLGYSMQKELDFHSLEGVRRALSLYVGNQALGSVFEKNGDIRVRESIAGALQEINSKLRPLGYAIGVETGHRSMAEQRVIKENHARTFGRTDANRLYADEGKSDHHTGGAIDVILLGFDGKKINLALGDNSPKTKSLLYGEEILSSGKYLSPTDLQSIEGRRLLYHVMTGAGFQPLMGEYWHYGWGGRLSRYLESKSKQKVVPSQYGNR